MSNTKAAHWGLELQTALMQIANKMSCIIDCQQPWTLNNTQRAEIDQHPEVRLLH